MVQLYCPQLRRVPDGNGATIVAHGRDYEPGFPPSRSTCCSVRAAGGGVTAARGARALARRGARRRRRRAIRRRRDPAARRRAPARARARDRRGPRGRAAREGGRRRKCPAGFAERIVVSVRGLGRRAGLDTSKDNAQVAAVQRGTADVMVVANVLDRCTRPSDPGRSSPVARSTSTSSPSSTGCSSTCSRRPSMTSTCARRSTTRPIRARLVELEGGRELATATCQILPRGFPGYEPYCLYTASSAPIAPGPRRHGPGTRASGPVRHDRQTHRRHGAGLPARRGTLLCAAVTPAGLPHLATCPGRRLLRPRRRAWVARADGLLRLVGGLSGRLDLLRAELLLPGHAGPSATAADAPGRARMPLRAPTPSNAGPRSTAVSPIWRPPCRSPTGDRSS